MKKGGHRYVVRHISKHNTHKGRVKNFFSGLFKNKLILIIIIVAIAVIAISLYIIFKHPFKHTLSDFETWLCNAAENLQTSSNACYKIEKFKFITRQECCSEIGKCCLKS